MLVSSAEDSSPLSILLTLFMIYTGVYLWKFLRPLNEVVLIQKTTTAVKFRHTSLCLQVDNNRWICNHENAYEQHPISPACLYLNEKFLRVVKLANRAEDSKSVVDRPTKKTLKDVLTALKCLNETNLDEIKVLQLIETY